MKCFLPIILLTSVTISACSQIPGQKINSYSFIKSSTSPNDSIKVKQGYWIETDTIIYEEGSVAIEYMHGDTFSTKKYTEGKKIIIKKIFTSKGKYSKGNKAGSWKYFDSKDKLYKEVGYGLGGAIEGAKYYYSSGKVSLELLHDFQTDKYHFKKYDTAGKIVSEGDVPYELVAAGLNYFY